MGRKVAVEEESDDSEDDEDYTDEEEGSEDKKRDKTKGAASKSAKLQPVKNNTAMEVAAGIMAAASVATSVSAMIICPVNVVYAAGGLSW